MVRKPGSSVSKEEVKKMISDKLAGYKHLTGGVVFVDAIPKSPNGKILKRILREEAQSEIDAMRAKSKL